MRYILRMELLIEQVKAIVDKDLPVVHMDNLYWNEDKTSISFDELNKKLLPYLQNEEWIVDGNYHDTLKLRLEYATDVFFLKMPREQCIEGILERIDQPRDDIPWVETKKDAVELIEWTIDYEERTKADALGKRKRTQRFRSLM